uniref:Uncharacterized protein n=1 Tax=Magallana gigas TaxID=29159 RepID=K1PRA5_MAGGI
MTKYRKQGFKSAGNAARYSKVTSAQKLRWARLKRPPDHDYFCSDIERKKLSLLIPRNAKTGD